MVQAAAMGVEYSANILRWADACASLRNCNISI